MSRSGPIATGRLSVGTLGLNLHRAGHGTPVLLLHGFPEIGRYWWPTMHALADDFHLIAPDLRGCGESDTPTDTDAYAIDALMADVLALLDTLDIECAHLVGHDWGGGLAWWFAACHPERVGRLVVCNSPHPAALQARLTHDAEQQQASAYMSRLQQPGAADALMAAGAESLWQRLRGEAIGYDADDRAAWIDVWNRRGLAGGVAWYRASRFVVGGGDGPPPPVAWTERLNSLAVHCPALIVWGVQDRTFVPALATDSLAFAPRGRVLSMPGAAHHPPREQPETFHAAVRRFLLDPTDAPA